VDAGRRGKVRWEMKMRRWGEGRARALKSQLPYSSSFLLVLAYGVRQN